MAAQRPRNRLRMKQAPAGKFLTGDSFSNFLARVGVNQPNLSSGGTYDFSPLSRNRLQMEYAYRSSWIAGMAVDSVAEDMTRKGVRLNSDATPEQEAQFKQAIRRLQIWPQLCETIKWSRLYGGAVAMFMIDGQDESTPLRIQTISKGQFKGLLPIDRWALQPSLNKLVKVKGPTFGLPEYYDTVYDTIGGLPHLKIHHTRLIRFGGVDLPYWQRISENLWGQSVLERLWDRLVAFDSATQGTAQLVYKAHLRMYSVEGLRELIADGGPMLAALLKQIEMIRAYQSNEGMTLIDSKDKFEAHNFTFSGLSDVIQEFAQQVAGALQIPMVRLLGQSPAGFSDGEVDLRTYYDGINQQQEAKLRPGVETAYELAWRSEFGGAPPVGWNLEFETLWQLNEEQRANVTTAVTAAVLDGYEKQVYGRGTALKELRQLSNVTGCFTNITDEDIQQAVEEDADTELRRPGELPPPPLDPNKPVPDPGQPGGKAKPNTNGTGGKKLPAGAAAAG
jgi:uncharacterized protein